MKWKTSSVLLQAQSLVKIFYKCTVHNDIKTGEKVRLSDPENNKMTPL